MVLIVTQRDGSINVSINEENLVIPYTAEVYGKLVVLTDKFKSVETFADAKAIQEEARQLVSEVKPKESNFVETAAPNDIAYDEAKGTYHLKTKDGVIGSIALPKALVERMLTSAEKGIDISPLVKATIRFFRNPKLNKRKLKEFSHYINYVMVDKEKLEQLQKEGYTEEKALELASFYQTPITLEGLLCTYKVSREVKTKWALDENGNKVQIPRYGKTINDLTGEITESIPEFVEDRIFEPAVVGRAHDAFYCESLDGTFKVLDHIYKVGHVQYLEDWKQVNCTDGHFGGGGLHLGNLNYINGYHTEGDTVVHNCFVDPMHIGAFTDKGEGAMRVKQLFIHSSKAGDNRGIYFSSKYAAMCDEEWEVMKQEAIKNSEELLKNFESETSDKNNFLNSL